MFLLFLFYVVFCLSLCVSSDSDVYISLDALWFCGGYEMLRLQHFVTNRVYQVLDKCNRITQTQYYIARFYGAPAC
jgi:hypothetical protein